MAYQDYVSELVGTCPRLSYLHAQQLVNRAWSRIRDTRLWSFQCIANAELFVPAAIVTGTMATTFGSTTIQADATARAAINAAQTPPPIAGPLGIGREIKLGSTAGLNAPTGPNYVITAYDSGTGAITIDKPFGESTLPASNYQILKCYYSPPQNPFTAINPLTPDTGFVRYLTIVNPNSGYCIRGRKLYYTQSQLNAIDPQRGGQGEAYIVANYGRNAQGLPVHELYPNPVTRNTYYATYQTRWPDLSPTQDLPMVPYGLVELLMYLSKQLAGEWALGNVGTYPELAGTNWVAFMQSQTANYREQLIHCFKQDDEIMPRIAFQQGSVFDFPLGGQFLQGHDVSSLIGP